MDHWVEVRKLIVGRHSVRLAAHVRTLDDEGRKQVAARLPELLKELRARFDQWDDGLVEYAPVLRVAGAGTLGGAAAVASWLYRRDFAPQWNGPDSDVDLVLSVLADRPAAWRADLAERLTLRLRTAEDRGMALALALLRECRVEPPPHDPLVAGWVNDWPKDPAADPLLDHLLPRLFEAEGVGRALQWRAEPHSDVMRGLLRLAASGRERRELLIDGCVRRFLRGGGPIDLRFFVRLHEALDPAPGEIADRARDYLSLLPASPGPVAELAMKRLRARDDLSPDDLAEAWEALLFRTERKLVRAGLSWLDRSVRRTPALADVLAAPLARAFAADSAELQEKAVELAIAHAGGMSDEGRATIGEAIELLAPELGRHAARSFAGGTVAEAEPVFVPPPLPAAPERAHAIEPSIGSVGELGRRLLEWPQSWRTWEGLLAGFVTLAARDRAAVVAELRPRLISEREWLYRQEHWTRAEQWLRGAGQSLTGLAGIQRAWQRMMPDRRLTAPHRMVLHRAAEVLRAAEEGTLPPLLLATPTHSTGHVAAAELVRRMEVIEAAGAKPLAADLQQALLRLPRTPDQDAAARAARLTSGAGEIVAAWTYPEATVTIEWTCGEHGEEHDWHDRGHDHAIGLRRAITTAPTGLPLVDLLLSQAGGDYPPDHADWWPAMLPSHREVAAAYLLPSMLKRFYGSPVVGPGQALDLARAEGPAGAAFALVLARLLGGYDPSEPVEVLLEMAARGELPAAEVGRHVGLLLAGGEARSSLMVAALEAAARAGAHAQVWEIAAAALPRLLPAPGERPRNNLAEFVTLALAAAEWSGARGEIPPLRDLAARKGNSGLARQVRRLHELLTKEGR